MRIGKRAAFIVLCLLLLFSWDSARNPADSQSLFDAIGRMFRGPPRNLPSELPREQIPGEQSLDAPRQGGPRVAYCVRLCDGQFFPISEASGKPEQLCSSLCPAAKTKIYRGSQIDSAFASTGEAYATLKTAFAYREKVVPQCGCTGESAFGLAAIDIKSDPTLRAGDIVMSVEGAKVFKGSKGLPYRVSDFSPAKSDVVRQFTPRISVHVHPPKKRNGGADEQAVQERD